MTRDRLANAVSALREDPTIKRHHPRFDAVEAYDDIRVRHDADVFLEARVATLIGAEVDIRLPHTPRPLLDLPEDDEAAFYETLRHEEAGPPQTDMWYDDHLDRALPDILAYDDGEIANCYDRAVDELERRGYDGASVMESCAALGARTRSGHEY